MVAHQKWAAALMLMALCLVAVPCMLYYSSSRVELGMFDGQPVDPIVTPLFMGYDAQDNAMRELARVAGPLGGAFSPASTAQLYARYRGLNPMGEGEGGYELVPAGAEYEQPDQQPFAGPELNYLPVNEERPVHVDETRTTSGSSQAADMAFSREERMQIAKDSVAKLYSQLHDRSARRDAMLFVQPDRQAEEIAAVMGRQASLHSSEPHLASEAQSSATKMKDDADRLKEDEDDLRLYKKRVAQAERLGNANVKYLKASQNYALEAKKEMLDAGKRDSQSMHVLATADQVLKKAHTAEIQARVKGDAAKLDAAERTISGEIQKVREAKVDDRVAAQERADAKENAFVSQVINKVRGERFNNKAESVQAISEEGMRAEKAERQDKATLRADSMTHEKASLLLNRAKFQDAEQAAVTAAEKDAAAGMEALTAVKKTDGAAAQSHLKWEAAMAAASKAEAAARKDEVHAAALAARRRIRH